MNFAGRSDLISFLDQLVKVKGGPQVARGSGRPVLVLEGCGGSGRSELLRSVGQRWEARTPTVRVNSLALPDDQAGSKRPLLAAVMLGLSADVPGYKVSFDRVVLAYIAMSTPVQAPDPERAVEEMRQRLTAYRDRDAVIELVGDLVAASAAAVSNVPGTEAFGPVLKTAAQIIVKKLLGTRWLTHLTWQGALEWFGHRDQGLHHDPVRALVQLSVQTHSDNVAVRDDVDDLLVGALLADLRDSLNRVKDRPWNAVVVLDNSDAPVATWFVTALVRVRQDLADKGIPPDPVTVVAASGGSLAASLAGQVPESVQWQESRLADLRAEDVRRAGSWLSIGLGELSVKDVRQMVLTYVWPPWLGTSVVTNVVHRLTGGHAAATNFVLRDLQAAPHLIDDMGQILCRPAPEPKRTVEQFLLDRILAGLSPHERIDPHLREDLVTLSAARDRAEAQKLRPLLTIPVEVEPVLFASTTLWSATGPRGHLALAPFIRYLLLRELANRVKDPQWHTVFTTLRDRLSETDLSGWLHHNLALGNTTTVAEELARLLPIRSGQEWLTLLDQTVATPDPRRHLPIISEPPDAGNEHLAPVTRLVSQLHTLSDPCLSNRGELRHSYLLIASDYYRVATTSPDGQELFLARAQRYQLLAHALT